MRFTIKDKAASVAFSLLAFVLTLFSSAQARDKDRPIVYAHYMHCYILGTWSAGSDSWLSGVEDFDHWPPTERTQRPEWSARLVPLASSGMAGVKTDFDLAQRAGLDALGLLIANHHLPSSQFAAGMRLAAACAQTHAVKLIPDLWGDSNSSEGPTHDQWVRYGQSVKDLMDAYPNAFLKRGNRWILSLGDIRGKTTPLKSWNDFEAFFEPWGGIQKFYVIVDTTWHNSQQSFSAASLKPWDENPDAYGMWCATSGWGDPQNRVLLSLARANHKEVSWPINSNFYGGRAACDSMAEDLGVSRLCDQWRQAIQAKTAFAEVQTWNDFSEDHGINETNYRGDSLIDLTSYFAEWFHRGTEPSIQKERLFLFHHRQLVNAKLTKATILAHNDKWHLTPAVDYLDVVGLFKKAATVTLRCGDEAWTEKFPKGLHEWLVYVPSQRQDPGPLHEAYTRPDGSSYPLTSPDRTVTVAQVIPGDVTPSATAMRAGQNLGTVTSRTALTSAARWQDLCLIGDERILK